jgi:predicted MFS family arabinose efflux permease
VKKLVFLILCLEGAILSFNVAATSALIPSIAGEFRLPFFTAGKIVWLYLLPYAIAALFYAPLVRIFNARKIELTCLILFSLANLLAGLAPNIFLLFSARVLMGIFGASVIPLAIILIAKNIPRNERAKKIGVFFGVTFGASLLGLFLSGILHWRLIYIIPAGAGFLLWIFMFFYFPAFKEEAGTFKFNYLAALTNKRVLFIFIYIFCISLIYHGIQHWLSVYFTQDFGLRQFLISMLIALTGLSGIFGEIFGGYFADRLGRNSTAGLGMLLMLASICFLILKLPPGYLAAIMILWGLGWTFNHAALSAKLADLPLDFVPEAAGLNSSVRFLSAGIGAWLGGVLMQQGFKFSFISFGVGLVVLALASKTLLNSTLAYRKARCSTFCGRRLR